MKLFKIYGYTLLSITVVNLIFFIVGHFFSDPDFLSDESDYVAPKEEWKSILEGKWEFERKVVSPVDLMIYDGLVTYFPDGRFKRHVNCKIWEFLFPYQLSEGDDQYRNGELAYLFVGIVTGTWSIDENNFWKEESSICEFDLRYSSSMYQYRFDREPKWAVDFYCNTRRYGDVADGYEDIEILEFSKSRIRIKAITLDYKIISIVLTPIES
ncbi:MAG: hypothetical protein ACRBG0_26620 [Lewinella sp.]|uniref:hypothetical protein n=1 Tax=Lewinella sp. TaxID=2004506 RepID=UPI003D6AD07E